MSRHLYHTHFIVSAFCYHCCVTTIERINMLRASNTVVSGSLLSRCFVLDVDLCHAGGSMVQLSPTLQVQLVRINAQRTRAVHISTQLDILRLDSHSIGGRGGGSRRRTPPDRVIYIAMICLHLNILDVAMARCIVGSVQKLPGTIGNKGKRAHQGRTYERLQVAFPGSKFHHQFNAPTEQPNQHTHTHAQQHGSSNIAMSCINLYIVRATVP